ncbi:gamma-glutamylcyclotransferase family protein [Candidatus Leptofilum sp.]|uniref:gamma-glutamylcyclotransferase family protein n=1 Tax=Candidatus Leptofilum sp. TaxID=3241576 RepID=UPI003B5B5E82
MPQSKQLPFFVYGTLLPEQPNFSLWESDIVAKQPATLWGGRLHDMGYYPMLVLAEAAEAVQGMVITVKPTGYGAVLQRLDALEGYDPKQPNQNGYRRRMVKVALANGRSQKAWVYLGQSDLVVDKPVVANGDWAAHAAQNHPRLQDWWETIQSVAGLHQKP